MKELNKKQKTSLFIGLFTLLIFVIGAAYAYFQIDINTSLTDSTIGVETNKYGIATIKTDTTKLYLKLTNDLMGIDYLNQTYYANSSSTGTPLTENPNYTLATVSLTNGDLPVDCTYNFKVTATVSKTISDGSDENVIITIGNTTKTLKELISAGTNGIIVSDKISNLKTGTNKQINISSTVINTISNQLDLGGNVFTISIEPYSSSTTKAFSCKLSEKTFSDKLVTSGDLWQSGFEGDGYRYVGSGAVGESTNPNNFVCFGTTSKSDCTTNPDKYMYRIIGVFADASGNNHAKLIKYKQLGSYAWNKDFETDVSWENSDLYKGLNGDYFLTNTTYDYMQNTIWLNKIEDWTWSAVNTQTYSNSGPNYNKIVTKEMYLHEMNRTGKSSSVGSWTTPTGKIGLMYASDYQMSLGSSALELTGSSFTTLQTGWMHQSNNDTTKDNYEWTIARSGDSDETFNAWYVYDIGFVNKRQVDSVRGIRPTFYLTSDVQTSSGTGSLSDPYILK